MKNRFVLIILMILMATIISLAKAENCIWTNSLADNDFSNPDNWSPVPTTFTGNTFTVNTGGLARLFSTLTGQPYYIAVGYGTGSSGQMIISGGNNSIISSGGSFRVGAGSGATGAFTMIGGTLSVMESYTTFGDGGGTLSTGATATVNIGGGVFNADRILVGQDAYDSTTLNVIGGEINVSLGDLTPPAASGAIRGGSGMGTINVSGSAVVNTLKLSILSGLLLNIDGGSFNVSGFVVPDGYEDAVAAAGGNFSGISQQTFDFTEADIAASLVLGRIKFNAGEFIVTGDYESLLDAAIAGGIIYTTAYGKEVDAQFTGGFTTLKLIDKPATQTIIQYFGTSVPEGWNVSIGSGSNGSTCTWKDGYLQADLHSSTNNNGVAKIWTPIGSVFPEVVTGGSVPECWMQFDVRGTSGSTTANTWVGVFNDDGDADRSPPFYGAGIGLASNGTTTYYSIYNTADVEYVSGENSHRVKMHIYNSGDNTFMDVVFYPIDIYGNLGSSPSLASSHIILASGSSWESAVNDFGIRNCDGQNNLTSELYFDNLYFSITGEFTGTMPRPFKTTNSVSYILATTPGDFDPWNIPRWVYWYESNGSGKLQRAFMIDCDVVFAGGHDTLETAWRPVKSDDHLTYNRMFNFDETNYSIALDGNGVYIDARPADYNTDGIYANETITDLYASPGTSAKRNSSFSCFCYEQEYNASMPPAVVSNFNLYGFGKCIATWAGNKQKIIFDNCRFFRNNFIAHIHGGNITIQNCQLKENFTGIYMDREAQDCYFTGNQFRDNAYQQEHRRLYGDFQMDSAFRNVIENNEFQPTNATAGPYYRCGIKFYRNKGETDTVRPNPSGNNIVRGNSFRGYTITLDVSSRQGDDAHDLAGEGRDFAYYNHFENNTFTDCTFGIKLNNSGNAISGNTFTNVDYPILLHNVFYSLTENTITKQPDTPVYYWTLNSQWYNKQFGGFYGWELFERQAYVNYGITESEKYFHIRTDDTPDIEPYTGDGQFIIADTQLVGAENRVHDISGDQLVNMLDVISLGSKWMNGDCDLDNNFCEGMDVTYDGTVDSKDLGMIASGWLSGNNMKNIYSPADITPIDIAVGDFWIENPGDEIAVIWDEPVSNIKGSDYYTIIMYDSNGIENNRCGKGTQKWTSIVAANVTNTYAGDEIIAISSTPDSSGCYPIYVYSYSRSVPTYTLLSTNTTPIKAIAAGNFYTGDSLKEIAYVLVGSTTMNFIRPTNTSWSASVAVSSNLTAIAGGDLDASYSGDEVAAIDNSTSIIYYYRVGSSSGSYKTAGVSGGSGWSAIGAGNFNPATSVYEVAVASSASANGVYKVNSYAPGTASPIKQIDSDVLGVSIKALDGGTMPIGKTLGLYERALGFYSTDYGAQINAWGQSITVLPSAAQTTATPVFWTNSPPADSTKQYIKTTPIIR